LITKNIRNDEEEEFIFKIEKKLLLSWEEVVNSLFENRFMTNIGVRYNIIPINFFLIFLLFRGLRIVTNVYTFL
jgi:hypothetical protein